MDVDLTPLKDQPKNLVLGQKSDARGVIVRGSTGLGRNIVAVTAVSVLMLGGVSVADGSSNRSQVITLISTNVSGGPVGPEQEFGLGVQFSYLNSLTRNGQPFGREVGMCTVVEFTNESSPVSFLCPGVLDLPDGQISTQALARDTGTLAPGYGAITGGTRKYRDARGQVRVTPFADGSKELRIEFAS